MSKNERSRGVTIDAKIDGLGSSPTGTGESDVNIGKAGRTAFLFDFLRNHIWKIGIAGIVLLLGLGIMARNGWLPSTDGTGHRTTWFGKELPKNASSNWNPFAAPLPTATPQLSKSYVYAGQRILAVEDANTTASAPADLAVWRSSSGYFYVLGGPGSAQTYYPWGMSGDTPVPGDYDGDGKTDFAVVRPVSGSFTWYFAYSLGSTAGFSFGLSSDVPAVADFDGDGKSDPAVFRASTGYWYWLKSSASYSTMSQQFGQSGDIPAPADYDGDGKADPCIWRYSSSGSTFYATRSSDSSLQTAALGTSSTDLPVSGDFDGDGKADFAILHGNSWTILSSSTNSSSTTTWQNSGDKPVQNDYDGDGKVDIAVWRDSNGTWYIKQSSDSLTRTVQWGTSGDYPVPAYYRR